MKQFKVVFEYHDDVWIASCKELLTTLEGTSFDALLVRMKIVIQDIVETELEYKGDIKLIVAMQDRVEEIKAAS